MVDNTEAITTETVEDASLEPEETQNIESQEEETYLPDDYGEPVTFEDIINDPVYGKEYQRYVDKAVGKAISSYKAGHQEDIDALVAERVNEAVNAVRFESLVNETLREAGVMDLTAYKAHLDMDILRECYDPETNTINGMDELIAESREKVSYLFHNDKNRNMATGAAQGGFGTKTAPTTLEAALHQKYKR